MGEMSAVMLDMLVVSSPTLRGLLAAGIVFNVAQQKQQQQKKSDGEIQ
jgi:hypothetical protein